jgi:hypothetical protein
VLSRCTGIAVLVALVLCAPASAATLHLSPVGSDGNPCTAAAPCRSFDRGYQAAAPGDTVLVAAGAYGDQKIDDDPTKDGQVAQVTLQAAGSVVLTDLLSYAANVRYSGFTVDGSEAGQPDIRGGHDVVVENVKATNFYITGPLHNITFRGGEYGPYASCGGGAHISGLDVDERDPGKMPTDILVDGVYFHDYSVGSSCPDAHLDCLHVFTAINVTVRNSTFARCRHYGILLNSNGSGNRDGHVIENNVFGDAEVAGFALRGGDGEDFDDVLVAYNSGGSITPQTTNGLHDVRWVGNAADDIGGCRSGIAYSHNVVASGGCGASDVEARPGFANEAAGDFHLLPGAAAIDRGDSALFPPTDHDGLLRPAGGAPDAGAMEFGARAPSGAAPPPGAGGRVPVRLAASLLLTRLHARKGVVGLRVRCAAPTSRCRLTVRLRARLPRHEHVSTLASGRRRLRSGPAVTIHLRLNRAARTALRRHRTLKVSVSMQARTPSGASARSVRRARLQRG